MSSALAVGHITYLRSYIRLHHDTLCELGAHALGLGRDASGGRQSFVALFVTPQFTSSGTVAFTANETTVVPWGLFGPEVEKEVRKQYKKEEIRAKMLCMAGVFVIVAVPEGPAPQLVIPMSVSKEVMERSVAKKQDTEVWKDQLLSTLNKRKEARLHGA